ncbi:cytochrome P450 [Halostella salina]|uniref:cytochrome P450 n=1 Tax=Halostella salina TaxID=1547897 RepID=UPI000EF7F964|nr:cytochrome P450 [Halostella salina]
MSDASTLPSPEGLPVLGHGMAFSRNPVEAMERWAAHGDIVRLQFVGEPMYMVTGPEHIERILVDEQEAFTIGPRQRTTFQGVEDDAMTTATGDRWKRLRRAAHPAFTRDRIHQYGDRMAAVTARFVDEWADGEAVDLHDEMRRLTVQILGETLLDADLRGREDVVMDAADALVARTNFRRPGLLLPDWVPTPTDYRFRRAVERLDAFVDDLLAERRASAPEREDVCSVLLDAHQRGDLSMDEVRENVVAFLLAGHESPAGALTRVWYLLDDHPDAAAAVRREAERVVDGGRPTAADADDLERTRHAVQEALRLYPPTTGVNRQATEPVTVGGHEFDAGAQFMIPQWVPHRDERYWDDPETFDPSRWTRDADRPEYAYFPFSGGPRRCIGADFARQELTLALATMAGRVELDVTASGPLTFVPSVQLRPEPDITATVRR